LRRGAGIIDAVEPASLLQHVPDDGGIDDVRLYDSLFFGVCAEIAQQWQNGGQQDDRRTT